MPGFFFQNVFRELSRFKKIVISSITRSTFESKEIRVTRIKKRDRAPRSLLKAGRAAAIRDFKILEERKNGHRYSFPNMG
jgi:hypothetical protein